MPVVLLYNQFTDRLVADLIKVADDPTLVIDVGYDAAADLRGTGQVRFDEGPVVSSPGTYILDALLSVPTWIGIRACDSHFGVFPAQGLALRDVAGTVAYDQYPAPNVVDVVYDVTGCGGGGFWVDGGGGQQVSFPSDVLLLHELAHVFDLVTGAFNPAAPEVSAISRENEYRQYLGLPSRSSHAGGCLPPPSAGAGGGAGGGGGGGCFIATAALGTPRSEGIALLKALRDTVIRRSRWGREEFEYFYKYYKHISPAVIRSMNCDERLRDLVRNGVVGPAVVMAKLLRAFPREDVPELPEPWRSFLTGLRDDLQHLTAFIPIADDLTNMTSLDAALEAGLTCRYLLRRPVDRRRYIHTMRQSRQLPVQLLASEAEEVAATLKGMDVDDCDIAAILGSP